MRFAIYGSGAVGGFLGARLLEGGHDVRFLARGHHLEALRRNGLRVDSAIFGDRRYSVTACGTVEEIGPVDYVVLGVKASSLPAIASTVEPLKAEQTTFVSTQNGLPWWYFHGVDGDEGSIEAVDPGGIIEKHIPSSSTVGSIAYFSSTLAAPGVIRHSAGNRLPLGEPAGGRTERVLALSAAFREGGIKAPVRNDIRHELWVKLLGNAAFNPLSALTRRPLRDLADSPSGRELIQAMMDEVRSVAAATGVHIALSNDRRIEGARKVGLHKTSMLQDLERGREPELDALLGTVIEIAARHHVEVPTLRAIDAAARLLFGLSDPPAYRTAPPPEALVTSD